MTIDLTARFAEELELADLEDEELEDDLDEAVA